MRLLRTLANRQRTLRNTKNASLWVGEKATILRNRKCSGSYKNALRLHQIRCESILMQLERDVRRIG
jgi:hypothetical protein